MFQVIIKRLDGSTYWTEHFQTQEAAQKWLGEEMTRKYWNADYQCQIVDKSPTPEQIAAREAAAKAISDARAARVAQLKALNITTIADVKALLRVLIEHIGVV